ncbi:AAA family ATPase [Ferrimonas sp. YFM]|uniref:AAA family ATPase n=1 Tax=Ferrimonas sp. YFM TaxID=3028878 RepID=UPI0025733712|nr:AAA family ATPase [Ferrimonas sp. YFM]BDY03812.1 hypothetical protein F0521_08530 [Ferrimonas sp. YFM]
MGNKTSEYSELAEQSLIGAAFLEGGRAHALPHIQRLGMEPFHKAEHKKLVSLILKLSAKGIAPDLVTLNEEINRHGIRTTGLLAYASDLSRNTPGISNVDQYARVIEDYAKKRNLNQDLQKALNGDTDALLRIQRGEHQYTSALSWSMGSGEWEQPYEWLIHSWVPGKAIGFISGPSANGKTFVAIDMIGAIATGIPFCGVGEIIGEAGAAAYFTVEGTQGIGKRLEAYRQYHEVDKAIWEQRVWQCNTCISFKTTPPELIADAVRKQSEVTGEKCRLILFDTFRAYSGASRENDSSDTELAIAWMRQLRDLSGATVLCIHHSRKGSDENPIKPGCDADMILRGSGNLKAGAEVVLGVVMAKAQSAEGNDESTIPFVWPSKLKDIPLRAPSAAPIASLKVKLANNTSIDVGVIQHSGDAWEQAQDGQRVTSQSDKDWLVRYLRGCSEPISVPYAKDEFKDMVRRSEPNIKDGTLRSRTSRLFNAVGKEDGIVVKDNYLSLNQIS